MALEKEFEFYKKHKNSLVKKYEGKFIVIVGNKVIGSFESMIDAAKSASKEYKPGTFMVKQVLKKEEPIYFHSRVFTGNS